MNKTILSSTLKVIFKVYRRFHAEQEAGNILSELDNIFQRTADMTGKSLSIMRRILEGVHNNCVKEKKLLNQIEVDDMGSTNQVMDVDFPEMRYFEEDILGE